MVFMSMLLKSKLVTLNLLLNMLFDTLVNQLWLNLVFSTMMVNLLPFGIIGTRIIKESKKLSMLMILLKDLLFISMTNILMLLDIMDFMLKNTRILINLFICLNLMLPKFERNYKIGNAVLFYILNMTLLFVLVVTLFTLTILFKKCIILLEFILGGIIVYRPSKTEFICTKCKFHEFIPTDIVLQLDMNDPGDPSYPPMFNCEKCNGLMKPKYFVGYTGIVYEYDGN